MCPLQWFCTCVKTKALGFEKMLINSFLCENFSFIYCRTSKYSLKKIFNFSVRRNVWPLSQNAVTNYIVSCIYIKNPNKILKELLYCTIHVATKMYKVAFKNALPY